MNGENGSFLSNRIILFKYSTLHRARFPSAAMPYTTLLSVDQLRAHLDDPDWVIIDCRFSLDDTERGRAAYLSAHIPGAVYAHLDQDLSAPVFPGRTGRHPLPVLNAFAQTLSDWGVDACCQVICYDDMGGGLAGRLWWMLRSLGHDAVAVLDGGWPAWDRSGAPRRSGTETRRTRVFAPHPRPELQVDATDVARIRLDPSYRLLDARAAERYRGEVEPIDPVAGHIPGATSAPFSENLDATGRFLSPEALRARFHPLLGDLPADHIVCYCGSGVTAAHNLLAIAHAGLGNARLYAGSWSDWITDPSRPVALGSE